MQPEQVWLEQTLTQVAQGDEASRLHEMLTLFQHRLAKQDERHWLRLGRSICPLLFQPLPAMQIVQMNLGTHAQESIHLAVGETWMLRDVDGHEQHWSCPWPTTLLPITLSELTLTQMTWTHIQIAMTLKWQHANTVAAHLANLRLFLNGTSADWLLERLLTPSLRVEVAANPMGAFHEFDLQCHSLNPGKHAFFSELKQSHTPITQSYTLVNYPILTRFIILKGLEKLDLKQFPEGITVHFILPNSSQEMTELPASAIQLNCLPLLNYYALPAEPIHVTDDMHSYPIQFTLLGLAIHQIKQVDALCHSTRRKFQLQEEVDFNWISEGSHPFNPVIVKTMSRDERICLNPSAMPEKSQALTLSMVCFVSDRALPTKPVCVQSIKRMGGELSVQSAGVFIPYQMENDVLAAQQVVWLTRIAQGILFKQEGLGLLRIIKRSSDPTWHALIDGISSCLVKPMSHWQQGGLAFGVSIALTVVDAFFLLPMHYQIVLALVILLLVNPQESVHLSFIGSSGLDMTFQRERFEYVI